MIEDFCAEFKKENGIPEAGMHSYRACLKDYLNFIGKAPLTHGEALGYLEKNGTLLIEMFSKFLDKRGALENNVSFLNNRLFKSVIHGKEISSKDYDERVMVQPLEFQIDNYYITKDDVSRKRVDIILSVLRPQDGELILDVGCGVGTFAYHSAKRGSRAIGIDYSEKSIEVSRKLVEQFGLAGLAQFISCDATAKLPFNNNYFDKIVAADFIEHIDEDQKRRLVSEMSRVLKPGGIIVVFTPNGIRETLWALKTALTRSLGVSSPETRLHYGLTNRFRFERIIREANLSFTRYFHDVTRPYLAKLPILKEILSLNILWVIKK